MNKVLHQNHMVREQDVQPTLSVCIVSWNRSDLLEQCLNSIYTSRQRIPFEVIVVDNGSSDGSPDLVGRKYPQTILIRNTDNRGFARANNQALKVSKGRYCFLLNNDTRVPDDTFQKMVEFMERYPDAGIATCRIYNPVTRKSETGAGADIRLTPSAIFWNDLISLTGLHKVFPQSVWIQNHIWAGRDSSSPRRVSHISGAGMIVRKSALEDVGLLDERFFMYLEETDWCYRFRDAGWNVYYTPEAEIVHVGEGSSRLRGDRNRIYYDSLCKFFAKHYGVLAMMQYRVQEILIFTPLRTIRKWLGCRY